MPDGRRNLVVGQAVASVVDWLARIACRLPGSRIIAARRSSRMSANLRKLGRQAEADAVARDALDRFPSNRRLIAEAALGAEGRHDYDEALRLWKRLVTSRKVKAGWSERYAANLIKVGRLDEAATVLADARRRYPRHVGLEVCAGLLAAAREDWTTAVDILARHQAKDPANPVAQGNLGRVLQARSVASVGSGATLSPLPLDVGRVENEAVRAMLLGFESLGDDCEFGIVQRRYGAEPLGLLRWNLTTPASLLRGLSSRFAGLGDPANLRLNVDPVTRMYLVMDVRFDFAMDTFMFERQVDEDTLFIKMCKVLTYLRDRFLNDLEESRKIFVYKDRHTEQDLVVSLHRALKRYGPARLLWILPIDATPAARFSERDVGKVIQLDDGLFVGFLSRLGSGDGTWNVQYEEWVAICERTTHMCGLSTPRIA